MEGQSIECEGQGRIHMFCSAVIRREGEEQAREVKRSARTRLFWRGMSRALAVSERV